MHILYVCMYKCMCSAITGWVYMLVCKFICVRVQLSLMCKVQAVNRLALEEWGSRLCREIGEKENNKLNCEKELTHTDMHTQRKTHTVSVHCTYIHTRTCMYIYVYVCMGFGEILLLNIFINSPKELWIWYVLLLGDTASYNNKTTLIVWPQNERRKECKDTGNSSMEKSINMHADENTGTQALTHSYMVLHVFVGT